MNKTVRNILIFLLAASVTTILVLIGKINSGIPENPSDYSGNTPGNLYNRGLFVRSGDKIFFANLSDGFRIYEMDLDLGNVKKLHSDNAEYLNLDSSGQYLYYSRINYRYNLNGSGAFDLQNKGIYRLDTKRKTLNRLFSDMCGTVLLAGNQLLFQKHGEDGDFDLYSISCLSQKQKPQKLSSSYFTPVNYYNGYLYYAGVDKDHQLYAYQPDDNTTKTAADIDCYMPICGQNGTYFLSLKHNYSLFLLPHNRNDATLICERQISTYNISENEDVIFYQIDAKKDKRLCRYDVYSQTEKTLMEGSYKNLNTVGNYLFFTDFNETLCYCYNINTDTLFLFEPSED